MSKLWTIAPGRRALVTGATGLVGQALAAQLGDEVVATTRGRVRTLEHASEVVAWDAEPPLPAAALRDVEAVFHLAGEPVVDGTHPALAGALASLLPTDATSAATTAAS